MTGEVRGRTLAIDLGDVHVGLAVSDPLGATAQPAGAVRREGERALLGRIEALVRERELTRVVVGHPLLLSGAAGERARDAQRFAARLRGRLPRVDVVLWDERLSTAQAERALRAGGVRRRRRREVVDSLAAVLILQSYLERAAAEAEREERG